MVSDIFKCRTPIYALVLSFCFLPFAVYSRAGFTGDSLSFSIVPDSLAPHSSEPAAKTFSDTPVSQYLKTDCISKSNSCYSPELVRESSADHLNLEKKALSSKSNFNVQMEVFRKLMRQETGRSSAARSSRSEFSSVSGRLSEYQKLEWTLLGGGTAFFLGTVALFASFDAMKLERDLHRLYDESKISPVSGALVLDLAERTERRAKSANILWGGTGAALVATIVLYFRETGKMENNQSELRGWERESGKKASFGLVAECPENICAGFSMLWRIR